MALTLPFLIASEADRQPAPIFIRVFAVFVVLCVLIIIVGLSRFFALFLQAYMSRVPVTYTQIVDQLLLRGAARHEAQVNRRDGPIGGGLTAVRQKPAQNVGDVV